MKGIDQIKVKLQNFVRKYYLNELIRGLLLFFSIGLLYLIFTLFIEYFFWLNSVGRTVLFWIFVSVELGLLIKYILIPVFKIMGLKEGISSKEASKIIGNHFPNVKDKLLNMLQLEDIRQNTELIEASIEQKSSELRLVPFKKAIDFSKNRKYLKYAFIPIVIYLLILVMGEVTLFNDSLDRVVHYSKSYEPPAPFSFSIENEEMNVVQGSSFNLMVKVEGSVIPNNAKIHLSGENYYLKNMGNGSFEFSFSEINKKTTFYLEANDVISKPYIISVVPVPTISNLKMVLAYPKYTGKANELIEHTGNASVPVGSTISWQVETHQVLDLNFLDLNNESTVFSKVTSDYFSYTRQVFDSFKYTISTSNDQLKNYENLDFSIQVIKDEFPKIDVKSDLKEVTRGPVQFVGQVHDDYGISRLQLVCYERNRPEDIQTLQIAVPKESFSEFYYVFPEGIETVDGKAYEWYFEVFDNDQVSGRKSAKSERFHYYLKTEEELQEELLEEQEASLDEMEKALEESKEVNENFKEFQDELQKKAEFNWNDTKKLEEFLKRQNQYQELFDQQTDQLQKNILEQSGSEKTEETKEELLKRLEETKKLNEKEKMLDELEKLSNKFQKEDLVEKLKEMGKKNRNNEQNLKRVLELTKRFYVEQKASQIGDKLNKLAEKEKELYDEKSENKSPENDKEKQQGIKEEFEKIKEDLKDLEKDNKDLERPMKFPDTKEDESLIDFSLEKALEEMEKETTAENPSEKSEKNENDQGESPPKSNSKKFQKAAAKKMQELSEKFQSAMTGMQGEMIDENIEDLRKIVENLIEFSFKQEDLFDKFSVSDNDHPEYPKNLKEQHVLKEFFEHIDDSLYVLSLRLVQMSAMLQKEVSDAHYYIDESLINFSENKFDQGISNQQFVITAANNLANSLSDLLENMMNASASGQASGQSGMQLPDIIEKQKGLGEQMKEQMKNGDKQPGKEGDSQQGENEGEGGEGGENDMEGLYEIYKQQAELRRALEELMDGEGKNSEKDGAGKVLSEMERLEKQLLDKGISNDIIQKIQRLNYELLKLEKAKKEQGVDKKRTATQNTILYQGIRSGDFRSKKQYFNFDEILNRQSLPLRSLYKKKVQEYFKKEQ